MDALVDFEELIELNVSSLSISQRSAQEPIADVLDKMCEAIDEKVIDNLLKINQNGFGRVIPIEFDSSESATLRYDEDELEIDNNMLNCNPNELGNIVADHLDVDIIDLDEFESIYTNKSLFKAGEGETGICDNRTNAQQIVPSVLRELPVEFAESGTEYDVSKAENTTSNKSIDMRAVSVDRAEYPTTTDTKQTENCTVLKTSEINIVKPLEFNKKTEIDNDNFENVLLATTAEYIKHEFGTDINKDTENTDSFKKEYEEFLTENIDANECSIFTEPGVIKDYNEAKSNDVLKPNTKHEDTVKTFIDDSDSEDGFDISDFEFISEHEASKTGIVPKVSKITINETFRNNTVRNTYNIENRLHNIQLDINYAPSTSNCDNKPRKNEASLSDYVKYSKYRYQRCYSHISNPTSELHVIPEGERYLDMFRGHYAPVVVNNLYTLKNKRALSAVAMAVSIEELAYRDPEDNAEYEKYKNDADDCVKKIISVYPRENSRKRRRH